MSATAGPGNPVESRSPICDSPGGSDQDRSGRGGGGRDSSRREKADYLRSIFAKVYGAGGGIRVVRAPGRVNLIGEHTDYNEGFVLPAAIDRDIMIAVRGRSDRVVRIHSLDYREGVEFSLDLIEHDAAHAWSNYPRGTLRALLEAGVALRGMDMLIAGDVPSGAGLSSSAALETATAVAAQSIAGSGLSKRELALVCQAAENRFVGVSCGIMDQLASALGAAGHALFIDCRSHKVEYVPVPEDYRIVICDSGVRRGLRDSEYNLRWSQCEEAVRLLQQARPGIKALRDVSPGELDGVEAGPAPVGGCLPPVLRRRVRHVVLENERVRRSVEALRAGRVLEFGRLMVDSHASLRDLFEVSCPELDALVAIALDLPGVAGARMTGAGFGGCTVNLVHQDAVGDFCRAIMARYTAEVDRSRLMVEPQVYVCRACDGAGEIE